MPDMRDFTADRDRVPIEQPLRSGCLHDARQVIVAKNGWQIDGAGRDHRRLGPHLRHARGFDQCNPMIGVVTRCIGRGEDIDAWMCFHTFDQFDDQVTPIGLTDTVPQAAPTHPR